MMIGSISDTIYNRFKGSGGTKSKLSRVALYILLYICLDQPGKLITRLILAARKEFFYQKRSSSLTKIMNKLGSVLYYLVTYSLLYALSKLFLFKT